MEPELPQGERPKRRRILHRLNLKKTVFVLPNLFTVSSIFCGFYALTLCASGAPDSATLFRASMAIFFAVFFDMFDGRVARMTRTQTEFGVQLDSLADVVSFGCAPALLIYKWGLQELGKLGMFAAFAYLACGALRLARFNVLASRSKEANRFFLGLPIPMAAGFIVSLVIAQHRVLGQMVEAEASLIALVLVLSYLMVSNVRYHSFKDVKPTRKNLLVFLAGAAVVVTVAVLARPELALVLMYGAYISLGLIEEVVYFRKRRRAAHADKAPETPRD